MVLEDVKEGFISVERAKEAYGVVIDEETMEIDMDRTNNIRSKRCS